MTAAGGGEGARLPTSFLVALTPSALRVYKVRQGWTGVKISDKCRWTTDFVDGLRGAVPDVVG